MHTGLATGLVITFVASAGCSTRKQLRRAQAPIHDGTTAFQNCLSMELLLPGHGDLSMPAQPSSLRQSSSRGSRRTRENSHSGETTDSRRDQHNITGLLKYPACRN